MSPGGEDRVEEFESEASFILDDSDSESDLSVEETAVREKHLRRKSRYISEIKKLCGVGDRAKPLNVAIIGSYGVGKSSFINTICASLSRDRWREHAYAGSHGGEAKPISVFVDTFEKCCKESDDEYAEVGLPTLIDIAGFPNEDTDKWEELLRIIFYGRLAKGESLLAAYEYCDKKGVDGLREKYNLEEERLKVDRVIFVGAANSEVPKNLIECVLKAARPKGDKIDGSKRSIPVYGVLTKCDLVDVERRADTSNETEREFVSKLGLDGSQHRFLRCKNYCDAVDGGKRTEMIMPELDVPVLKFLRQVVDPEMRVQWPDEKFTEGQSAGRTGAPRQDATAPVPPRPQRNELNISPYLGIVVEAILVAMVLHFLLASSVNSFDLASGCSRFSGDTATQRAYPEFGSVCRNQEAVSGKPIWVYFLVFLVIRVGSHVLTQFLPPIPLGLGLTV